MTSNSTPDVARLLQAADRQFERPIDNWRQSWQAVREEYRSLIAQDLDRIAPSVDLSPATLQASVDALLAGLNPESLQPASARGPEVTLVVLAASVPALAAQCLYPLLARGSVVLLRPSSREPLSPRLLLRALGRRDAKAAAAVTLVPPLPVGERADADLFGTTPDRVVAYGDDATVKLLSDHFRSAAGTTRLAPLGHGWSAVYLDEESATEDVLSAVARDIALFDQRGCLCPQVVLGASPATHLVSRLGAALNEIAEVLPPSADTATLGALRQMRDAAVAAGLAVSEQPLATGLAVEGDSARPIAGTPGGRSVRVYGGVTHEHAVNLLQPVLGHLQSVAVAIRDEVEPDLKRNLTRIGVRRVVVPGELHRPGFEWVVDQLGLGRT